MSTRALAARLRQEYLRERVRQEMGPLRFRIYKSRGRWLIEGPEGEDYDTHSFREAVHLLKIRGAW